MYRHFLDVDLAKHVFAWLAMGEVPIKNQRHDNRWLYQLSISIVCDSAVWHVVSMRPV